MTAKGKILIVEDESIIAEDISSSLRRLGYQETAIADTGHGAIEIAGRMQPDLVLMDVKLKGSMDGIEAAGEIRLKIEVPVIYLTANADRQTIERAKLTDPYGYIVKPFTDRDLNSAIEIALHRHQLEQKVYEHRQWLDSLLRGTADGVVATDAQGRIRLLNPVAERLTGWIEQEAIGKKFQEVVRLAGPSGEPVDPIGNALSSPATVAMGDTKKLVQRNGREILVEDTTSPISDTNANLTGAIFLFRDVSEKRHYEEALQNVQRMEAVGKLASGVAHDFNNLLTIIMCLAQIEGVDELPMEVQSNLEAIGEAANTAGGLSQKLLHLGRNHAINRQPVRVDEVIFDLQRILETALSPNIELIVKLEAEGAIARVDREHLQRVILNLVLNAKEAVGDAGTIVVSTSVPKSDHFCIPGQETLQIVVTDNGPGIEPDVKKHIFEPFFTTKTGERAFGLGLAIVYGAVTQNGGRIDVQSEPGLGSSFVITFPIEREAVQTEPVNPIVRELNGPPAPGATVLLVEDRPDLRALEALRLEATGYRVQCAADGHEALGLFRSSSPDILVTDVAMPGMTGTELAKEALLLLPDLKILFVSGCAPDTLDLAAFPGAHFLAKPYSGTQLVQALSGALAGIPRA